MSERYLMACGCVANGEDQDGNPVCAIHGCYAVDHIVSGNEGLEGRQAKCAWCGHITDSSYDLPFFEYRPDKDYDGYYDGCGGWD